MKNKILIGSLASLFLMTNNSLSEIKVGNAGSITGTVGVASQYISKGIDSNRDQPTAFLTGEFASKSDIQLILGAGIFYSRPDKPVTSEGGFDYELDYNIGLRKTIDKLTLDIGYVFFTFPQAASKLNFDSSSYYAKAVLAATKDTTLSIYYEQDDTKGFKPGVTGNLTGKTSDHFYEVGIGHNLGPANLNVSYGDFKDNITFYKIGLSKEFLGLNFNADYISQDRSRQTWSSSWSDAEYLVVGASKTF
jgi:uncharacterized protein (TIGR02001 family)